MGLAPPLLRGRLAQAGRHGDRNGHSARAHSSGTGRLRGPRLPELSNPARALGTLALLLLILLTWQLSHTYRGIFHDAGLYVLQGLASLQPSLRHDVFLHLGSQARFSALPPLFALTSRLRSHF